MSILPHDRVESATPTPCPSGLIGCTTDHDDPARDALCGAPVATLATRSGATVEITAQAWSDDGVVTPLVGLSVAGVDDAEFDPATARRVGWALIFAAVLAEGVR